MDFFLSFAKRTREDLSRACPLEQMGSSQYLNRRDATPAICYDDCNGAYMIGQSMGKTGKLCSKDSSFRQSYSKCRECIVENTDTSKDSAEDNLDPQFREFIDFCDGYDASSSSTDAATSIVLVTAVRTQSVATTSSSSCKVCSTMTITGYDGKLVRATIDLEAVTRSFTDFSLSTPTTTSTSTSTSDPSDPSSTPNLATIIGPVVPSFFLLLVLGFLAFRWYKRRQALKTQKGPVPNEEEPKQDKPQLHSDCITRPTFELEGSMPAVTDFDSAAVKKSEMAANEPAAHEMDADKKIARKPVGNSD
ncbi:hypothetical protein KAF25_004055 [Fusarium avenaceum]|uniref:Uncharacterized protein n=1 Tax=Fusarium avenaceum TaxID=40199 RepID=A0A9P7KWV6_9HYPO|nr:hypothetical protein KAF25_004055 [Fusarium avenaceum]